MRISDWSSDVCSSDLREERARLSRSAAVTRPIDYLLKRWSDFARFAEDGRICLTNNAAERALRGFALGRKSWLFAGSDRGAERAAVMVTLIMTAKLNDIAPQRSEEHTSELQSLMRISYAVFGLKKKKTS